MEYVAGTWYPIGDGAPLDGSTILLGYLDISGKFAVRSAYYMDDVHHGMTNRPVPAWVCNMGKVLIDQRATHWSPMQKPPLTETQP